LTAIGKGESTLDINSLGRNNCYVCWSSWWQS